MPSGGLYEILQFKLLRSMLYTCSFVCTGDVMFADMKSENGRPAGYGTVRFKNPDDAARAIGILCSVAYSHICKNSVKCCDAVDWHQSIFHKIL